MDTSDATLLPLWNWRLENLPPRVLHPALGPSLQGHWGAGECPEKGRGYSFFLWGRVWSTSLTRSWRSLERRADLSTLYNSLAGGWSQGGLGSSHREQVKGQENTASSCTRWASAWTTGRISSQKGGSGIGRSCPRSWWSPHPWMQHCELCPSCHGRVWVVRLLLLPSRMGLELYWAIGVPNSCLQGSI